MSGKNFSIFREYYTDRPLIDRFKSDPGEAVDVIIPILHTNELWRHNLRTIYREIPVNRLLIGDGGCIDDSVKIAQEFPRVHVLDHRQYKSLGFSIRKLIEEVRTEWFMYLHSDVSLPPGWFDTMKKHKTEYDWFGCPQQVTLLVDYRLHDPDPNRPYAGTQMGRKAAFTPGLHKIDDDYVYRQEDFVFAKLIADAGFKEGRIEDTFHYHQVMHKPSPAGNRVKNVSVELNRTPAEEIRTAITQARGIVKYLEPSLPQAAAVVMSVNRLEELKESSWPEFEEWTKGTNPAWLPLIRQARRMIVKRRFRDVAKSVYHIFRPAPAPY